MFWLFMSFFMLYLIFGDEVRRYFQDKKTPEQKYYEYQQYVKAWNGTEDTCICGCDCCND